MAEEEKTEVTEYHPPTMEEVAKYFPAYGGLYALAGEDARKNLEKYVFQCIEQVENFQERICLTNIWETEKGIINQRNLEEFLKTHKIFCDGIGKTLQREVIEKFIKSQPSENLRKSCTQLWNAYQKANKID